LAALEQRHRTGRGQSVDCSLYETTAFLVGQHMAQKAVTGEAARPMPVRISAWAIYDVFETADGEQVFVGVVSDAQWRSFCKVFGCDEWAADASLALNNQRVKARDRLMPELRARLATLSKAELLQLCEAAGLPFAPIARPEDLDTDAHLTASEGLVAVTVREGVSANLPALPLRMDGRRAGVRQDVPRAGEHSHQILTHALGLTDGDIEALKQSGVVA
jgi:crotonobetainyl-CoA:carnitine CoA-transferase CaiB-like acyl-CoA transferase